MADEKNQNTEAQRAEAQRAAQQQRAAAPTNQGDQEAAKRSAEAARASQDKARQVNAQNVERDREQRASYPQQTGNEGQTPTPTQEENDELRAGLRHIDEKQDDGSGPDHGVRLDEMRRRMAAEQNKDYKTR